VIVRVVSAIGGDVWEMDLPPETDIGKLKREVAKKRKVSPNMIAIAFRGMQLDDDVTLKEAGVEEYDKLYIITRTEGG